MLRLIGILLFLTGFLTFTTINFTSQHSLSKSAVEEAVRDSAQQAALLQQSQPMMGKTYNSNISFSNALVDKMKALNAADNEVYFNDYQIDSISFSLTKATSAGFTYTYRFELLLFCLLTCIGGALLHFYPKTKTIPGVKNDHIYHRSLTSGGWMGIVLGSYLILFYIALYFYPYYVSNMTLLVDPLSKALSGNPAGHWFLYGFLYTLAIVVMGVRMLIKWRHNKYQIVRTFSVMFFQTAFAFVIPEILVRLKYPYYDFKNMWPLDYDFFYSWQLDSFLSAGNLGLFMLMWGIALPVIGVPVITYFYGKRWYCSWVCGCGGLAETAGDPFRQLSNKSLKAWQIERYLVHGVLVFAVVMTIVTLTNYVSGYALLGSVTGPMQKAYGFYIGALFSGVVGTGFYPLMGNRVWCRFGCPLAAYLGLVQRFKSRFRITTNGGQCISCGNCSTYCEMGIDVKWYAQRGQDVVRSSCVGCGICSAVCPRGVLNLENGSEESRVMEPLPFTYGNKSFQPEEDQSSTKS